jgi:hypothetical protein
MSVSICAKLEATCYWKNIDRHPNASAISATYLEGDSIIDSAEVKLGGKVPLTVVCALATDFVSVKGKKCLVGRNLGRAAIEEVHGKVEDAQTRGM